MMLPEISMSGKRTHQT